jgi:hypothetical protein
MGFLRWSRAHAPFTFLLIAGAILRAAAMLAYRPGFEYADSAEYLLLAARYLPTGHRPIGYSIFLSGLSVAGQSSVIPLTQHALGLIMAVVLYVLLLRIGVRPWLAALGAAPVLLDGYQLDIEHYVLAETLAEALLVLTLAAVLWTDRPRWWLCVPAGLLLAGVAGTRAAAIPLILPALLFVLLRAEPGRRGLAAAGLAVAFAAPLAANMAWSGQTTGQFTLSSYTGQYLYGRVAVFADCSRVPVTQAERRLCPDPARRQDETFYVWSAYSAFNRPWPGYTPRQKQAVALDFSLKVVRYQPLDFLRMAGADTLSAFAPFRDASHNWPWVFPVSTGPLMGTHGFAKVDGAGRVTETKVRPELDRALAADLRAYQGVAWLPGTALAVMALAGLLAGAGLVRPGRPAAERRLSWAALLLSVTGLGLIVVPAATIGFDYRYVLPSLVALPPAAAAAVEVGLRRLRDGRQGHLAGA